MCATDCNWFATHMTTACSDTVYALLLWLVILLGGGWMWLRQRKQLRLIHALEEKAQASVLYQAQSLAAMESEIRSSLNGITGYAEYVAHHATDPMIQFTGTIIYENSIRLLKTSDVMLDMIHSRPGQSRSPVSAFSLQHFFTALRRDYESALQQKALLLECEIDLNLPDPLHGKAQLVRKVIANLTENAIRFCRSEEHTSELQSH